MGRRRAEERTHTFPTKSWVRVSRRGLSKDGWEVVAIFITASMSSFVGVDRVGGESSGEVDVRGGEGCRRRLWVKTDGRRTGGLRTGRDMALKRVADVERERKRRMGSCTRTLHSDKNRVLHPAPLLRQTSYRISPCSAARRHPRPRTLWVQGCSHVRPPHSPPS